uniref:hypothetical protein n=1 Tax=Pedobacter glucosidilyticus TaxID=1122941 RepID=UPI00055B19BD
MSNPREPEKIQKQQQKQKSQYHQAYSACGFASEFAEVIENHFLAKISAHCFGIVGKPCAAKAPAGLFRTFGSFW